MNRFFIPFFLFSILFFTSCINDPEPESSSDVNPESIFFDYQVRGEEGNDYITVLLQFRFGGENGGTLLLEKPSKAELDGELIPEDSSKMTGTFYEIQKPVELLTGKHSIVFTDIDKKKYKEEFSFQPVTLATVIPDTIRRDDLVFEFKGLEPQDYVRLLLTDTSFTGDGINRLDIVRNGRLIISKKDLENLVNGPVQLEFIREYERPVRNGTTEGGGRISVSYSLKREFILAN